MCQGFGHVFGNNRPFSLLLDLRFVLLLVVKFGALASFVHKSIYYKFGSIFIRGEDLMTYGGAIGLAKWLKIDK